MQFVFFYHSLISDWNHGNAHFLRGIATELQRRGHGVRIFEPADGWSLKSLRREYGPNVIADFEKYFPALKTNFYSLATLDLNEVLEDADVVIVHEWNEHELVRRIGNHRSKANYILLFHDTHHRALTDPGSMSRYELDNFDGVLAFGAVIRDIYVQHGWARRAWTWHEAADTSVFRPMPAETLSGDVVWVGNWGDEERSAELTDYLIRPITELGLRANAFGVRYPEEGIARFTGAGIPYCGWIPNYRVPDILCHHRVTVHIPRRPYVAALRGIPTIRVFEALACGVPLVCSRWDDVEGLFSPGEDFLMAATPEEMKRHLWSVVSDAKLAEELSRNGLNAVISRHTCAHRVNELFDILKMIRDIPSPPLGKSRVSVTGFAKT